MRNIAFVSLLGFLLAFSSCKKDDGEILSNTPELTFVSISPASAVEYQDEITIQISYKDGNGDLGENTQGVENLFVKDSRNDVLYAFRVKQLAPDGGEIAIQGELEIQMGTMAIIESANTTESVTFDIYMVDRAGNQSNTITTSSVLITQ